MLGVASIALRAAGCTWPAPSADPISRWELDETSSASVLFEDHGPAFVRMTVTGVWPDMTTGSLVEGADGTSAYTDGSAYATIPAGNPAHDLAALTISFYYQRASADAKQILLAAGSGAQPGDFSIEVLANGRLRGWHTGQDRVLLFFEDTTGIAGTNLQVGTAHRIDLSLGSQGARLYLDGAQVAAIPAHTNGWNNTQDKYLGRWTDGVLDPADGAFDRIRLWNRQLANAEIAELEPAQSIILSEPEPGEPAPTGDAPALPSLAEWLPSDEADPTATKYVSNQNRGNGSGASPVNAQEVQAALNSASPGDVLLAVCQTPGTIEFWNYPNGLSFPSGTSGNYITLQARQGDGVVISRGEDFAGARTPNSGFWTQSGLSQDDIDKNIWRSTATFSGGEQAMMGWWIEFDHPHQLIRYSNLTNLRAPYGQDDSPTHYAIPGVHKGSDGRVYIRMQKPHPGKYSFDNKWSSSLWHGHPEAISNGQLNYPISDNPNDYVIYLTRVHASSSAFDVGNRSYVKIGPGINSMGHHYVLNYNGDHIWLDRGTHYSWQLFLRQPTGSNKITDYFLNRVRCTDGAKKHGALLEWKFGGWLEGLRSLCLGFSGTDLIKGVYFKDCTIGDWHDWCVCGKQSAQSTELRVRNCTFNQIFDDGIQSRFSMSRVEVGYCLFFSSDWGGMGGSGADGQDPDPGQWYVHHNIFDWRSEKCDHWRSQAHPQDCYTNHSADGDSPRKIYNNLAIAGPDRQNAEGIGFEHNATIGTASDPNNRLTGVGNTHQVFNNIILEVHIEGTKRYDPTAGQGYGDSPRIQSDFIGCQKIRYSANETNELFDYNLYWRPATMAVNSPLYYARGNSTARIGYASLDVWRASAEFAHSKLSGTYRGAYTPGVDGNSTMTKPVMGTLDNFPSERLTGYRPSPTTAVTVSSDGSSLNGQNWWDTPPTWGAAYFPWNDGEKTLAPSNYKGALDPNGSTMPVGVQNP